MPLLAGVEGDKIALIASSYGRVHNPGWYYNLKAHPECKVTYTSRTLDFTARSEGVQNAAANAKDVDRKIDLENFPYLTTPFTAQLAAARTLRAKSLPLRKASFKCSRAAFGFRIGAPFALECPEQGVDRAFGSPPRAWGDWNTYVMPLMLGFGSPPRAWGD